MNHQYILGKYQTWGREILYVLIHLECTLNEQAKYQSDTDSVLNSGTEQIIRFRFASPVSIMEIGIGTRLRFSVFKYGY